MRKLIATSMIALILGSPFVHAGAVMDLVTKNASGQETDRTSIFSQYEKIRMDEGGGDNSSTSMIFLGNEFLILNHKDKTYYVIDEAMLDEVTEQVDAAMQEVNKKMAGMDPKQREMIEQMMKGQMQGMRQQKTVAPPPPRVEAVGSGQWQTYPCKKYSVYEGIEKIQDICAAALSQIDGAEEVMRAFRNMAKFVQKMTESMPMMSSGDGANPGELMDQIDGFPVHTIEYENGELVAEVSLESVIEQNLDEDIFAAPAEYTREDLRRR